MHAPPKYALVLSGGGARGAYEAGVLLYLSEILPKRLGRFPRFAIVCGSSVGAIHSCFWASRARAEEHPGQALADLWRGLRIRDVVSLRPRELLAAPFRALGWGGTRHARKDRLYGFFNTRALEEIVRREIRWPAISEHLRGGHLESLCVAATEVATGRIVSFVQSVRGPGGTPPWSHDPNLIARRTRLHPHHALASAAIPVFFPAVRVGRSFYVDGGLRLNTPLAPALRLGADRVLVVSLSRSATAEPLRKTERVRALPTAAFLYGKVLNALLLDHIDRDLAQMRVINALLDAGTDAYGPDFLSRISAAVAQERGRGFRPIRELVIHPSRDLGEMAGEAAAAVPRATLPWWARALMRSFRSSLEADTLSYLYFDRSYTEGLVNLGLEDARDREEEFLAFFEDAA